MNNNWSISSLQALGFFGVVLAPCLLLIVPYGASLATGCLFLSFILYRKEANRSSTYLSKLLSGVVGVSLLLQMWVTLVVIQVDIYLYTGFFLFVINLFGVWLAPKKIEPKEVL